MNLRLHADVARQRWATYRGWLLNPLTTEPTRKTLRPIVAALDHEACRLDYAANRQAEAARAQAEEAAARVVLLGGAS